MAIIQRSLQLTEHASARTATLRFCRIVSKVNKAYSSSGKEERISPKQVKTFLVKVLRRV